MDEYRALAASRHARHLASKSPISSDTPPAALSKSLATSFVRTQTLRDQVVCSCTSLHSRCSACIAHQLAGTLFPVLGSACLALPQSSPDLCLNRASLLYRSAFDDESDASLQLCHQLSQADKRVLASHGISDQRALIYGEIRFFAFARMFELALSFLPESRRSNPEFCDLGSGVGKPAMAAALLWPVRRSVGIELLPSLHQQASQSLNKLQNLLSSNAEYSSNINVEFICGDLFDADLSKADIVFVASTGFDQHMFQRLADKLCDVSPGSVILTLSLPLPSAEFEVKLEQRFRFSWGNCSVFFAIRQ